MPPLAGDAERLQRARRQLAIFEEVIDLDGAARATKLVLLCGEDRDLRREVEELLANAGTPQSEILPPLPNLAAPAQGGMIGRQVGPYRLEKLIGEGGMGVVYQGRRDDLGLHAAIKVVRQGSFASHEQKVRLHLEARTLARLQHGNIARLYDAGLTEEGLPYLAMELVEGKPLDRHCDDARLDVDARLALFETVCLAVDHAHRNQIVHRDLKPSNILVSATGEVKLLDFGIAKLLLGGDDLSDAATATAARMLTPQYAAPEQFTGGAITTETDVYALGVVLYELLTGRRPGAAGPTPSQAPTREPIAPSLALANANDDQTQPESGPLRSTTTERLRKRLRGDLDTIVLKAIRPEPGHRYTSARELALDITLHRLGQPIAARIGETRYRWSRFVRRHRGKLAAAVIVFAAVGFAGVNTFVQGRQAAKQRDLARLVGRDMIGRLADGLESMTGPSEPRIALLKRAADLWDDIEPDGAEAAETAIKLAHAYGVLGARSDALAAAQRAVRTSDGLPRASLETSILRARALVALGDAENQMRRPTEARAAFDRAVAWVETLPPAERTGYAIRMVRENALSRIGFALLTNSSPKAAEPFVRGALTEANALVEMVPNDVGALDAKATSLERLADVFYYSGRQAAGCEHYRLALAVRTQTLALTPEDPRVMKARSIALQNSAWCFNEEGKPGEAVALYEEATEVQRRLHRFDPSNVVAATAAMGGLAQLADLYQRGKQASKAQALYGEALAIGTEMARRGTGTPALALKTNEIAEMMAGALLAAGDLARAEAIVSEQTPIADRYLAAAPNDVEWLRARAYLAVRTAKLRARANQQGAAVAAHREALELFGRIAAITKSSDAKQRLALAHHDTGLAWRKSGNERQARASFSSGRDILVALQAAGELGAGTPGASVYLPAIEAALRGQPVKGETAAPGE